MTDVPPPSPELLAEVQGDLSALAANRRRRMAVLAAIALAVICTLNAMRKTANPALGTALHLGVTAAFLLGGMGLLALAFGVRLPAGRRLRPVVLVGGLAALGLLAASVDALPDQPFHVGAVCLGTGLGLALLYGVSGLLLGRRVLRRHAPSGALLGVGAGLLALVTLHLACATCPASYAASLVWHGGVPVLSGLLFGFVWGRLGERQPRA